MFRIRPYRKNDAQEIVKWCKDETTFYKWSAGIMGSFPLTPERLEEALCGRIDNDRYFPFVAVDNGVVVGFFILRQPGDCDEELRFGFVIVSPQIRGKGYGKKMLELGKKFAFEIYGAKKLCLGVFENSPAALHCYKAVGFKETGIAEKYKLKDEEWTCIGMEMNRTKINIETERLIMREYTTDDFAALYEIMSDAETMQHYPAPFDEEKTRGWIKWNLENYEKYDFGLWAVVLKETGEFIGDCGITIQNIDGELLPEIGYHIHKKYWSRGFAKEAARAVRDWVFTNTDYNEIYSYMKYTNVASYSTAIAIGMRKVKEYLDPKNYVSYAYAIKRADWENIIAGQKT